ncbi:unnamed protein product [Rhizoctonia solani]|uniref:Uncharacterized protein n=1 Tax=Rhizoctonia solani TaxID=456999 RepID=A0A8H3DTQ0_9AGAM|nr:unnamed protein product [Rhizoctonia solani]
MEPSSEQKVESSESNGPIPTGEELVLENVNTSSLKIVLQVTASKNGKSGGTQSIKVDRSWMFSNLRGADEANELSNKKVTQANETIEGRHWRAEAHNKEDTKSDEDPRDLIKAALSQIQEDFKSYQPSDGSKFRPYGMGVGERLSKLLEGIDSDDNVRDGPSIIPNVQQLPDDDDWRSKTKGHLGADGKRK